MVAAFTVAHSCVPQSWVHAVNSLTALRAAAGRLCGATEQCPIGLEVDVRVAPHDAEMVPLLHHDPITAAEASTCVTLAAWLEELAGIVRSHSGRLGVVKLDFKDPSAAVAVHSLLAKSFTLYSELSGKFSFWWNADVLAAGHLGTVGLPVNHPSFTALPEAELYALIHAFVSQLGVGLSFGWRLPDSFTAYSVTEVLRMRKFVRHLAADAGDGDLSFRDVRVRPACVTFAVRYSAVFATGATARQEALWQALDNLLGEAQRLFTTANDSPPCFLSFWRDRGERLTDAQVGLAKARFPGCTIDAN
ncbi:hypothetical protein TraAM80_05860 [Trypanosoma rangeli]|uniref:Menorin-like domain-containing protein n=1 Tax=Trypanosoma rangeli TaxID=5698 RepID=A0A3R7K833_TRYRA|nr:uncharacterized protein TraAM80_05860 [Trypanosoma rangeli]RNF03297.1 hypothetical protein TraAM80_05860 [Trypanosoma rangeli]|eukprot:RNF03297.1 hypothetical protein TraAM80_05860 [Trypanosoma rangeli]